MKGESDTHRQQQLYWNQMTQLRIAAAYIRRYRDDVGAWVKRLGILKAIASNGSIAGWLVWKEYAPLWAVLIGASQLADALKDVFPVTKLHKSTSEHSLVLGSMFIDAQAEWESISFGRYTDEQIAKQRYKLMKLQHDAEKKSFPEGLPFKKRLFNAAQREAEAYFTSTYNLR